jgi:hypothetical protein
MIKLIKYLRDNYWRFTPDSWPDWYNYWKNIISDRIFFFRHFETKPWENNSRCVICAGIGIHPKYEDECDDCKGNGQYPRHWETKTSRVFKCLRIRINNKIEKNLY